jgi:predicted NBD/HSP70 family sugar kinase
MINGNGSGEAFGPGAILALFRQGRAHTRADLVQLTGMARSTVAQRLDMLLTANLLVPEGESTSTGGRPPTQFSFNACGGVLLCADIGASHLRCAVTDLAATVLAEKVGELDVAAGPYPVLDDVAKNFATLLAEVDRSPVDVRGIGISVPGPVEFATGRVFSPPIMTGWDGFDIPGYFAALYICPTLVDNDVNAMAFGEQRVCWPQHRHMLMIKVGTGVGCGIIASGEIHRGAQGTAGDIGHIPYKGDVSSGEEQPICRCGNIGCVEAYAGGWALLRDLRNLGYDVHSSFDLVRLIRAGQPDAMRLARQAGRVLGQAISDAVSFFNPSLVVIGGQLAHADEPLLAGIREIVYRRSAPLATRDLQITTSQLNSRAGIIGLALMLGDHIFAPQRVDQELEKYAANNRSERTEPVTHSD